MLFCSCVKAHVGELSCDVCLLHFACNLTGGTAAGVGLLNGNSQLGLGSIIMTEDLKVIARAQGMKISAQMAAQPDINRVSFSVSHEPLS